MGGKKGFGAGRDISQNFFFIYFIQKTVSLVNIITFSRVNRKVSAYFLVGLQKKLMHIISRFLEEIVCLKVFCELGTSVIL